jgi:hypothetical protein
MLPVDFIQRFWKKSVRVIFFLDSCLSRNEDFLFEIKDWEKNKHRHMYDIPSIIFFV